MKRVLLALLLMVGSAALAVAADRAVSLTPDGTLYAVESLYPNREELTTTSGRVLKLSVQHNGETHSVMVPASLDGGYNVEPSLAYDSDSNTLFIFWQKFPTVTVSELLFCSYRDGVWSEATSIDKVVFRYGMNLRIGVTRLIEEEQDDGSLVRRKSLLIHAIWWEQNGQGEIARYARLAPRNGRVETIEVYDLPQLLGLQRSLMPVAVTPEFDRELLRYPGIFESLMQDSVDVLFGDWETNRIYRVELRPRVSTGVLKPPIPRSRGEIETPMMQMTAAQRVEVISAPTDERRFLYYFQNGNRVDYLVHSSRGWSNMRTITLSDGLTFDEALTALRQLLVSQ
jgi:hypothetical protein